MSNTRNLDFTLSLIDKASAPMKQVSKNIINAQEMVSCGLKTIQGGIFGVMGGIYGLEKLVTPAREFNKALAEVESLGVVKSELDKLGKSSMDYATKFGGSMSEYIRSGYDIQSAITGLADGELASFTNAANITAKATKASAGEMTSYMGTMYSIFEKDALKIGKAQWADNLMGKTAKAVQIFKTTGPAMSSAFTNIGANATQMGVSLDEQIATLGTLQAAMPGEKAGTAYAAFMRSVVKANDLSKKTGLTFFDKNGMLPIVDIIEKIKGKYGGLSKEARAGVLKQMFGDEGAISTINALWDKTDGLKQSISDIGNIKGLEFAENMANTMVDPIDRLKGTIEVFKVSFAQGFTPIVNILTNGLTNFLSVVKNILDQAPLIKTIISTAVLGFMGLTIACSAAHIAFGAWKMIIGSTLSVYYGATKSIAFHQTYLAGPLRDLSKSVIIGGIEFPGAIQSPEEGDVLIKFTSLTEVTISFLVAMVACPKKIKCYIALDLNRY